MEVDHGHINAVLGLMVQELEKIDSFMNSDKFQDILAQILIASAKRF